MTNDVERPLMPGFGNLYDVLLKNGVVMPDSTWNRGDNGSHFVDADGNPIPSNEVADWNNERIKNAD